MGSEPGHGGTMHAEVIAIGDELTSGQSLDTNCQWLSRRLHELGIWVSCHMTVADDLEAIAGAFRTAIDRSDVVVVTGGLGPTADDLTRQALAATLRRPLVCDPGSLEHIRSLFARRGWKMPERNAVQAMLPEGGRVVPNPHGTAPGIAVDVPRPQAKPVYVYCLPGVPAEMREMWIGTVENELRQWGAGGRTIRHRRLRCFGAGEGAIEAMLPDLVRRGRVPRVGITASGATITLSVTAEAATEAECLAAMEPTLATIRKCLGNLVFGEDDDELRDVVVRLLRAGGKTLAVAEWASDGLVLEWLRAAAAGGPEVSGGVVVSGRAALADVLGIPPDSPWTDAREAADVAQAMAAAVRGKFGSDYGLAIGPGPPSGQGGETLGPVGFGLAAADGAEAKTIAIAGHPALLKVLCAKTALNLARLALVLRTP